MQTCSSGLIAELGPERLPVGERGGVEAGDVAGEVEVLLGPVPDRRQIGAEGVRHDVVGAAHVDGAVAEPWVPGDVLDHLGVVVSGEERLAVLAIGHREPADEVGEPAVGRPLLLGVLVEVVVELPGLVADPQVVVLVADEVVEHHEVGDEDLVHPSPRLEAVQVVLGRLRLDVARLVGEERAGRVDALTVRLEHRGDGMLREPVDLEIGMEAAQLVGDRHVALRVAQPDGRGDVERSLRPGLAASPPPRRPASPDGAIRRTAGAAG